jgi:mutator protein MutT
MRRVVCGLLRSGSRVFSQQRKLDDIGYPGHWEFPGGSVEPGEHDREALVREMREELGVVVVPGDFVTSAVFHTETGDFELVLYIVEPLDPDAVVQPMEAAAWGFYQPLDIPTPWVPSMTPFLNALGYI